MTNLCRNLFSFTAILCLVIVGYTLSSSNVMAEETEKEAAPTPRQISDFSFQYEQYRELYETFENKRDDFLKHKTLASQNDAIDQTQKLLAQRAQTMRTYFFALKYQVNANQGVDISEKSRISAGLDDRIGWFVSHKDDVDGLSNPSLSQLFEISKRMEIQQHDLRIQAYEAKAFHVIGKIRTIYSKYITINNNIEPYVAKGIKTDGYLNNWLDEAKSSGHKALDALQRAENAVTVLQSSLSSSKQTLDAYNVIIDELEAAKRNIKAGTTQQLEITEKLREILPKEDTENLEETKETEETEEATEPEPDDEGSPSADTKEPEETN